MSVRERGVDQCRGNPAKRNLGTAVPDGASLPSLPTRVDVDEPLVWWPLRRRAEEIGTSSPRCPEPQGELKLNRFRCRAHGRDQIRATLLQAKLDARRWLTDRNAESHRDRQESLGRGGFHGTTRVSRRSLENFLDGMHDEARIVLLNRVTTCGFENEVGIAR